MSSRLTHKAMDLMFTFASRRDLRPSRQRVKALRWIWAGVLMALCSCSSPKTEPPALVRFEFHQPEMGVRFRLVFYADNQARANAAAEAAFGRIQQLNDIMSDYDPD